MMPCRFGAPSAGPPQNAVFLRRRAIRASKKPAFCEDAQLTNRRLWRSRLRAGKRPPLRDLVGWPKRACERWPTIEDCRTAGRDRRRAIRLADAQFANQRVWSVWPTAPRAGETDHAARGLIVLHKYAHCTEHAHVFSRRIRRPSAVWRAGKNTERRRLLQICSSRVSRARRPRPVLIL